MASELDKLAKHVMFDTSCLQKRHKSRIQLSPVFEQMCGGLPGGSSVVMTGPAKLGKTLTALDFAKRAQQQHNYKIIYVNSEARLKDRDLNGIQDLDQSHERFQVLEHAPGYILSAEDFLGLILRELQLADPEQKIMVIIDSISQMSSRKELDNETIEMIRNPASVIVGQFLRRLAPVLGITDHIMIAITHIVANTSGWGKSTHETGGNKLQYANSLKFAGKKYQPIKDENGKEVGRKIDWICETSEYGYPNTPGTSVVKFGLGIDDIAEMLPLAVDTGVIQKNGPAIWVYKDQKWKGEHNFTTHLHENSELKNEIINEVNERLK